MDLGMIGDSVEESSSELEIVDFQDDEIILVASPSHPVHSLDIPSIEQIMEFGLVAREQGSATRLAAERQFRNLGTMPRIAVELGSNQAVKQAASAGGGIGIISRLGITAELNAGMLKVLDVLKPGTKKQFIEYNRGKLH